MTPTQRDRDLLDYIRECIDRIAEYLRDGSGPMMQDAVLRRLETLADAAGHLSDDLKRRHPDIAWRRVVAFRNILAHGYVNVQQAAVDRILDSELPALEAVVEQERSHPDPERESGARPPKGRAHW